jgi:hypothetical protein
MYNVLFFFNYLYNIKLIVAINNLRLILMFLRQLIYVIRNFITKISVILVSIIKLSLKIEKEVYLLNTFYLFELSHF